jgi:hypothetical protein
MKNLNVGKLKLKVCEHQGDINYLRFVKFKQYAPQFWEKMDSPLFAVYMEKYMDFHNKGQHGQALMVLHDYKLAIDLSKNSYDAWGICFSLLVIMEGEDEKSCPDDSVLKEKLQQLTDEGLTAEMVKQEVVNFMKASPEVFSDHLILFEIASIPTETI